jgi:protein-S-isoprenylcysteine O-methyltransferase Ste14
MNRLLSFRPPRIAIVLIAISIGLWFFSPPQTLLYIPYKWIAGVSIVLGFAVMTWAWLQFRKSNTAVCPTSRTSRIVTNGANRIFIPYEEEKLLSAFGDVYSNYQRVTRRWL